MNETVKQAARYEHDCDCCRHLGALDNLDVYICGDDVRGSYIFRYGSEGHQYSSFPYSEYQDILADIASKNLAGLDADEALHWLKLKGQFEFIQRHR